MKILMIGTTDSVGGAARVGWNLKKELGKSGHSVKYLVAYKKSNDKNVHELSRGMTSHLDKLIGINLTNYKRHLVAFLLANDIDYGLSDEVLNHPWYKEADIVHLHNLHGNFFKLKTLTIICNEKKVVWTLHDMWPITAHCVYCYDCGPWRHGKHHKFIWGKYGNMLWDNSDYLWSEKKEIYNNCSLHLVPSSHWLNEYVKKSILKDKPRTVIHNSVDTRIFKPENKFSKREVLDLPKDKTIISFIAHGGKNDPRKGSNFLFDIAEKYQTDSDKLFLCIGGGSEIKKKDNIIYIPFVSDPRLLAKYYQASDMYLFISLADNCPHTPIEAMSCGIPVVTFDVGGVKEIIEQKDNGYVAKYKNFQDLIKGLEYISGLTENELSAMKKRNRQKAIKSFSTKIMSKNYEKVYKKL